MRARIKPSNVMSKKQREAADEYVAEEVQRNIEGYMRRTLKLICVSLNEEYGFGKQRCIRLIDKIGKLSEEHKTDELYWVHIDRIMKQIDLPFQEENYEELE